MKYVNYFIAFILGGLTTYFVCTNYQNKTTEQQSAKLILNSVKSLSKLVVTKGEFSEVFSFSNSQKYFYDFLSFNKKAILLVNAKIEVGYDLSKLNIQVDSIGKQIIINKIPSEEISIIPSVKYFDLQQSTFNSFSKKELNKLNAKAISNIKKTAKISHLKEQSRQQLVKELSKIYVLSKTFGWKVIDNTRSSVFKTISKEF